MPIARIQDQPPKIPPPPPNDAGAGAEKTPAPVDRYSGPSAPPVKTAPPQIVRMFGLDHHFSTSVEEGSVQRHCYTDITRGEIRPELTKLTFTASTEKVWVYVKYIEDGVIRERLFNIGDMEAAAKASGLFNLTEFSEWLANPSVKVLDISLYHIHPIAGSSHWDKSLESLFASPGDLAALIMFSSALRRYGYFGPLDFRIETPFGEYILTPNDKKIESEKGAATKQAENISNGYLKWFEYGQRQMTVMYEPDVLPGLNKSGVVSASYAYHNEAIKDVIALYEEFRRINNEFKKQGLVLHSIEEVEQRQNTLDDHYRRFSSAISIARASGTPDILLKFYDVELQKEFKVLSQLSEMLKGR